MKKEKVFSNAFLSFKSFLQFMIIAGLIISLTGVAIHILSFIFRYITGEPNLSIATFFKPFLSIIIEPIDALISGCIFYPVYKLFVKKYMRFDIRINFITPENEIKET